MPRRTIDSAVMIIESLGDKKVITTQELKEAIQLNATNTPKLISSYMKFLMQFKLVERSELDPDKWLVNKDEIYRYR